MNKLFGTITHIEFVEPQKGETIPLKFFIKAGEKYKQGLTGLRPYTETELSELIDQEKFIPVQEKFIEEGEQVLMDGNGKIYITKTHAGLHTKDKNFIEQFSFPEWA